MNDTLKKVIWAGIPERRCTLNCDYCYVWRKGTKAKFDYPIDYILKCFDPKRFGGPIFFGGAASGETMLWEDIVPFTKGMLEYGHVVSYTSNVTFTPTIDKLCALPENLKARLEIDASYHYLELLRTNKLDLFFDNIKKLKDAGISYAVFLVIVDAYLPHLKEMSRICKEKIGVLPIAGMERSFDGRGGKNLKSYSPEVEKLVRETCDVRQWDWQKQLYGEKRKEFCHAGQYSINMNLATGNYNKCWGVEKLGNLYENPEKEINFQPIGFCPFNDCVCASYQCWGLIPELKIPTHPNVFFTKDSVSPEVWSLMDTRITEPEVKSLQGIKLAGYKVKSNVDRITNVGKFAAKTVATKIYRLKKNVK